MADDRECKANVSAGFLMYGYQMKCHEEAIPRDGIGGNSRTNSGSMMSVVSNLLSVKSLSVLFGAPPHPRIVSRYTLS